MFSLAFLQGKVVRYILIALAILALVAAALWLVNQVYQAGKTAGLDEATSKSTAAMLELQQALNKKQSDEALAINTKIDQVLVASQGAVTAVEEYAAQGDKFGKQVLSTIKGQKLYLATDCGKVSPEFQRAWEQLRKGAAK